MLSAELAIARQHGAELLAKQVVSIAPVPGGGWAVHTVEGTEVEAEQVVIAAGPHADELQGLPRRPLIDVVAESVVMARVSSAEQRRLGGLPSIIVDDVDEHFYVVPPTDYPDGQVYVKLGATRHDQWVLSPEDRRVWMTGAEHETDLDLASWADAGCAAWAAGRRVVDQAVPHPRHAHQAAVPRDRRARTR